MQDYAVMQARQIAGDFLGEKVKTSYPIIGRGVTNQVCVIETKSNKVVVRMNDKETLPQFTTEKWCIEQAAAVGIPGPEVLSIGVAGQTAYMIQNFINGNNGLDSKVPRSVIWRQLGKYARDIHLIPVQGYGGNLTDSINGEFQSPSHAGSDGSWQGYVQYNINSLTESDRLIELGVINKMESQKVRKLFESLMQEKFQFGLNHGDLSIKNTIIDQANQIVLLDWNAEVSVIPHATVAQLMHYQILGLEEGASAEEFKAFLDGYGISTKDLAGIRPLLLLKAFDTLRWAIDRRHDLIKAYAAYAKQVVDRVLD